MRLLHCLI